MNTDVYTKVVLTVIAGCLVWMCLSGATPGVMAQAKQPDPTPVILVDERGVPVPTTTEGLRINLGALVVPVAVRNQSLPVHLTSIQRGGRWDAIDVQVGRSPSTPMPTP